MTREMKDSGIPWIGEIPENWEVKRLKQESIFINGFAFDSEDFKIDEGVRVIRIGDIGLKADFENCVRAITNSSILKPYRIEDGDILIAMSGATTGKCCIVDKSEEAYINQRVGIIRSDIRKIIYYSLQTPYFMEFVNLNNAGSAQPNISSKAIGEFPILSIPTTEQQRIAEFLDRKCAEVDEMIGLQEQIIEELKAYKQSVITEAVTKGLNPTATMRDSGIEWIGSIPEHWEVCRGKNVLVLQKRPVRDNDEVVTCFRDGEVVLRSLRRTEGFTMSDKEIGYQGINEGDIVIHGMDGFAGAMGVSKSTGKGSPVLVVCSPKYDAVPQFIVYYLRALAIMDVFVSLATGIRERSCDLRWNKISELPFVLPSSTEQQAITDYLDEKCADIDSLIQTKQSKIDSLKEYKKSIIYEYVTGKREVEL